MSVICSLGLVTQSQLSEVMADPESVVDLVQPEDRDVYEDPLFHCVEGNWTGMHYLLNGSGIDEGEAPLDFFTAGGAEVGDIDLGYGPARVFTPSELAELARALASITDDMLRSRFDAPAMDRAEVHGWEPDDRDVLVGQTRELLSYLAGGAARGLGLIVWYD
jgi:hypothetical protein